MQKIVILFILLITLLGSGCQINPGSSETIIIHYLHQDEYNQLLGILSSVNGITRKDIDNALIAMGVNTSYASSFYSSGDYDCFSMLWSEYGDNGWDYYISVDIWTTSGTLNLDMCSYYNE